MTGAGDLRSVCTFQKRTETSDGAGGFTTVWGTDLKVQGQFRSESGREALRNGRLENSVMASLRCRESDVSDVFDVDEGWRVTINSVIWNVRASMAFGQRNEWRDFILERAGKDAAT